MPRFFLELLNISITASWLILAVILLRLLFKRFAPKWIVCMLWALVGIRLLFPFSIESNLSLLPSKEVINTDEIYNSAPEVQPDINYGNGETDFTDDGYAEQNPSHTPGAAIPQNPPQYSKPPQYIDTGFPAIDDKINNALNNDTAQNPIKSVADKLWIVWACGTIAMFIYGVVNYILLRRKVSSAIPDKGGIRRSEAVGSPFILGLFKPKIYLPFGLNCDTEAQVIAHERAHIKRRDHFIKPIGFVLLSIYWFNPVIWVAYILLCRDIEMACDEKVVKNMNADARKAYASALLECGVKHSRIAACPLAFGEIGVKQRVKNALNYKKPLFWIIIVSVIICIAVAIFFLTNPSNSNSATDDEAADDSSVNEDASDTSAETSIGGVDDSDVSVDVSVNTPEVSEPEVSEPEISEPEVSEPEISEPEISEPEVSEPEVSEPEVSEPENSEPDPDDFTGNIHTYEITSYRLKHINTAAGNKELIRKIINDIDGWQKGYGVIDFEYNITLGDGNKAVALYYHTSGILRNKKENCYVQLSEEDTALINAIFANPETVIEDTKLIKLTVCKNSFDNPSVFSKCFIATDSSGKLYRVYSPKSAELKEGYTVEVKYANTVSIPESIFPGYHPNLNITALSVDILSKPKTESLNSVRNVNYLEYNYWVRIKKEYMSLRTEGSKYGISSTPYVIRSYDEFMAFRNKFGVVNTYSSPGFEAVADDIEEGYFNDKALIFVYAWSEEMLAYYDITGLKCENGNLTLSFTAYQHDGHSPEALQDNIIVAEVKQSDIADFKSIKTKVSFKNAPDRSGSYTPADIEYSVNYIDSGGDMFRALDTFYHTTGEFVPAAECLFTVNSHAQLNALHTNATYNEFIDKSNQLFNLPQDFFEEKALICIYAVAGSGGDVFTVKDVRMEATGVVVDFEHNKCGMTSDMQYKLFYITVDKEIVESCGDYTLNINYIEPVWE